MSAASNNPTPPVPPVPSSPPTSGGVRRHHTISTSSRAARNTRDTISEENPEAWNDDEFVGEDWVGGVGAVGEKTSLHRQASLPTRYHRAFQNQGSKIGNVNPALNSLTAIAGHDGDEEEWEHEIGGYGAHEEEAAGDAGSSDSPLSPYGGQQPNAPSPPPAGSGVRRHVSLTYGAQAGARPKVSSGLKRSGTLQTASLHGSVHPSEVQAPVEVQEEEYYEDDPAGYDDEYFNRQGQTVGQAPYGGASSPPTMGRSSPWSSGNEWRAPAVGSGFSGGNGHGGGSIAIDDVQRALSNMEINSGYGGTGTYQPGGQSVHPPRFNPTQPPPNQAPGMRGNNNGNGRFQQGQQAQQIDLSGRKTPLSQQNTGGSLHSRRSNPNIQYQFQQGHTKTGSGSSASGIPSVPPIPQQYLQQTQGQQPRLGVTTSFNQSQQQQLQHGSSGQTPTQGFVSTPIDVPSLIATKGYNPPTFDIRPPFARYFVIKSFTEDDVHKSLKYEIWSSTDPGNKRLDKAFKECAGRGPIYLFFSVNASGHFCGMAEMLTPVDYTRSSTVWASDKWKGVFKVRWIFVRDIPNIILRHIKLNNTQERKPVTNSRDTQELLPEAGQEMLRIFYTHPAKTSLLQDFGFYELQAMQKMHNQSGASSPQLSNASSLGGSAMASPQLGNMSPALGQQQQQNLFNNNALTFQSPMMTPMMQMQMQMGMGMGTGLPAGMGSPQFGLPQTSQMTQSVLRNASTSPVPAGQQQGQQSPGQANQQQFMF